MPEHNEAHREFHFTARDFERVKRMIYARAGIALASGKEDLVYSRLARRLRACGEPRFDRYPDALDTAASSPEWADRKSVGWGKRGSVSVDTGGRRRLKKK